MIIILCVFLQKQANKHLVFKEPQETSKQKPHPLLARWRFFHFGLIVSFGMLLIGAYCQCNSIYLVCLRVRERECDHTWRILFRLLGWGLMVLSVCLLWVVSCVCGEPKTEKLFCLGRVLALEAPYLFSLYKSSLVGSLLNS